LIRQPDFRQHVLKITLFNYDFAGNLIAVTDENCVPLRDYIYFNGEPAEGYRMKFYLRHVVLENKEPGANERGLFIFL